MEFVKHFKVLRGGRFRVKVNGKNLKRVKINSIDNSIKIFTEYNVEKTKYFREEYFWKNFIITKAEIYAVIINGDGDVDSVNIEPMKEQFPKPKIHF